jgi:hypothetical protein
MFTQTYQCRVTLEKSGHLSWSQRVLYFDNSLILPHFKDVMECRNDKLFIIIIVFCVRTKKNEENDGGHLVF